MQRQVGRRRRKALQARSSHRRMSQLGYDGRHSQVHSASDIGELKMLNPIFNTGNIGIAVRRTMHLHIIFASMK